MKSKITKKQRQQLLKDQHECCALCKKRLSVLDQVCYDSTQNKLVDRKCMLFLSCVRAAQKNGISPEMLIKYENGE